MYKRERAKAGALELLLLLHIIMYMCVSKKGKKEKYDSLDRPTGQSNNANGCTTFTQQQPHSILLLLIYF
jgi:hypothetical protein